MAFPVKQFYQRSFSGPGFVAESRFEPEPGTTAFNICCFSLGLRVLHPLGQKKMKKRLISRAWHCLNLQRCLSRLPKVSVWEWILRFYGSPSLTILPYFSHPLQEILPPWIAQCCDLVSCRARNEFLAKCCCLKRSDREITSSSSWE